MDRPSTGSSYPPVPAARFPANSAVSPNAYPDEDWRNVTDLAERRRIQNRIAQRNYRQKMKKRLEKVEKGAPSIAPERSRLKLIGSRNGEASGSGRSVRPRAPTKDKFIRPDRSTMDTPVSSRRPSPLEDGAALHPAAYSPRLPDHTLFTTTAGSSSYMEPAISAAFHSPPITFSDFSHYPSDPLPSTSSSPYPTHYHGITTEPYVPFSGGLTSYAVSYAPTPVLEAPYSQAGVYTTLAPHPYPFGYPTDTLTHKAYRDTDPELQHSRTSSF